jgi:hypothetical protein
MAVQTCVRSTLRRPASKPGRSRVRRSPPAFPYGPSSHCHSAANARNIWTLRSRPRRLITSRPTPFPTGCWESIIRCP